MVAEKRPNILFLLADDQRFDTIHALGNRQIRTPTLDRMVARGTAFTNAYIMGGSHPAVCMPSRAMLVTGRTLYNIQTEGWEIAPDHALLGETFRRAGYSTWATGKWHNGRSGFNRSFAHGDRIFLGGMWDHWNVPYYHYDPTGKYEATLPYIHDLGLLHQHVVQRPGECLEAGKHSSNLFCDAAIDFLQRYKGDDPFLMYVSFLAPHDPRSTHPEFHALYNTEEVVLPPNVTGGHSFDNGDLRVRDELLETWPRQAKNIRRHMADYYAMISHLDSQIGHVLDALKRNGRLENTIIVMTGDNGLAVGQHGLMGKQNVYEHSVHVPLILCGPGIPQGERRGQFCYLIDVFPTLAELCGVEIPPSVDGQSLVPVLRDPTARSRAMLHFAYCNFQRAVRGERYKLIEYVVNGERTTQLFDLLQDPWERFNLAEESACSGELARMRHALELWREDLRDTREQGRTFWSGYGDLSDT